jgi:Leu/Phe-tRNA-protein transferase
MNPHLLSMGAEEISREEYLQLLDRALNQQP